MRKNLELTARSIAEAVLSRCDDRHIVVGPLVWRPSDGRASKRWYFSSMTADPVKGFHMDQITVADATRLADRAAIILALMRHPPLVIHDFDDELAMAQFCEVLWPSDRITRLRKAVEVERGLHG